MLGHLQRRTNGAGAAAVALAGLSAVACSAIAPVPVSTTVDCSVEDAYEFRVIETYEDTGSNPAAWFSYGDMTPGARHTGQLNAGDTHLPTVAIEGTGRCESKRALLLATSGHQDYGSGFGSYCLDGNYTGPLYSCAPQDGSSYEGFSFWARDPAMALTAVPGQTTTHVPYDGGALDAGDSSVTYSSDEAGILTVGTPQGSFAPKVTNKGVTVYFGERHAADNATYYNSRILALIDAGAPSPFTPIQDPCTTPPPIAMGNCVTTMDQTSGNTTMTGSGCIPLPNQCGNSYNRTLQLTDQWQLYTLPFSSFKQDLLPNRTSEDVDPSTIFTFGMRFPKEAVAEVWISKLAFYRKKTQ